MKKLLTLTIALTAFILSSSAQCVPDSAGLSQPNNLIYPAMVPCILPNTAYTSVLSILVPDSLPGRDFNNPYVAGSTVYIDSVNIQSISGYPSGITSSSYPALGAWIQVNGYACTSFSGTTTAAIGNYPLSITGIGCGHVIFPILGQVDTCMPFNFSQIYPYDLQVCDTQCSNILDTTYVTLCRGDSVIWGSSVIKRGGRYIDTVLQSTGCDSLNILFVTTANPAFGHDSVTGCYAVSFGGNSYVTDTTLTSVFANGAVNGCDSIARHSIIIGGQVVPTIAVSNGALLATDPVAVSYQWLQNGTIIGGATAVSYSPTGATQSSYTVVATDAYGCTDTSVAYIASGINELHSEHVALYPNPNTGSFILATQNARGAIYTITNELGQVIVQNTISTDAQTIDLGNVATGVYTISVKGIGAAAFTVTK